MKTAKFNRMLAEVRNLSNTQKIALAEVAVSLEDRGFILQSAFDKEIAFTYYIRW